jgi:hypothetical protein
MTDPTLVLTLAWMAGFAYMAFRYLSLFFWISRQGVRVPWVPVAQIILLMVVFWPIGFAYWHARDRED